MGTSCNGICKRYKIKKPNGTGRYSAGQKRCNLCDIFIQWEGLFCPSAVIDYDQNREVENSKKSIMKPLEKMKA
jgi:hypothetical protein